MSGNGKTNKKNYIYFKKYRIVSSVIFAVCLVFSLIWQIPYDETETVSWGIIIALALGETLVYMIIMSIINNRAFNKKVIPLMDDKCDPESFTEANMQFLNVKTPKADADVTNANIAFGEFYMGNAGKAISIMNSIIYSDDFDKTDMLVKAHYLINLVMYMMGSDPDGNMESIDRIMNEIHGLYSDIERHKMSNLKLDKRIESLDCAYAYRKGKTESYEANVIKAFNEDDNSTFGRVTAAFSLVKYYKSIGNTQEMLKYADFVIANGNKLYFVPIVAEWKRQAEAEAEQ